MSVSPEKVDVTVYEPSVKAVQVVARHVPPDVIERTADTETLPIVLPAASKAVVV